MTRFQPANAVFGTELAATMTGATVLIGTLPVSATIAIFDNQGTASVQIYVNQTSTVWRTFPSGEALVLDLRSADTPCPQGYTFYGNGASGTFSISYLSAEVTGTGA